MGCIGVALGACAANTSQQNLAYERWARCDAPYVSLERIGVDGRIAFTYTNSSARQEVLTCLAQAGRGGPPLPEPVAIRPTGGQ